MNAIVFIIKKNMAEKAACAVYKGYFAVTSAGTLHFHGPQSDRPGSQQLVVSCTQDQSATSPDSPPVSLPSQLPRAFDSKSVRATVPIFRQLPKPSRRPATSAFCSLLEEVVKENSVQSWQRLLSFAPCCLFSPKCGGKRWSLASQVNKQIDDSSGPSVNYVLSCHKRRHGQYSSPDRLRAAVTQRLEEGDFRGAIRIAFQQLTWLN